MVSTAVTQADHSRQGFISDLVCVDTSFRYERFFGPLADHHLCVTNAMKEDLKTNWGIRCALFI